MTSVEVLFYALTFEEKLEPNDAVKSRAGR